MTMLIAYYQFSMVDDMEKQENRVTVSLPPLLLNFVEEEVERRGLNPKKKSVILLEALSEKYHREREMHIVPESPVNERVDLIESLSDAVVARAFEKIELRIKKK